MLNQAISIIITDYTLITDSPAYHHCFVRYDPVHKVIFSDLTVIHVLELSKIPRQAEDNQLWDWLTFINSTTEEEFTMIAAKNPQVAKAVVKLEVLSKEQEARMLYENREKARMIANAKEEYARDEGIAQGISQGLTQGFAQGQTQAIQVLKHHLSSKPANEIATLCNLSIDEVKSIIKQFG